MDEIRMLKLLLAGCLCVAVLGCQRFLRSENYAELVIENKSGERIKSAILVQGDNKFEVFDIDSGLSKTIKWNVVATGSYEYRLTVYFEGGRTVEEARNSAANSDKIVAIVLGDSIQTMLKKTGW